MNPEIEGGKNKSRLEPKARKGINSRERVELLRLQKNQDARVQDLSTLIS